MCKGHLWVFAICAKRRDAELSIRSSPRAIMAWKFLALFLVLTFSVESTANQKKEQARNSNCKDSEPFFIKNRSGKAKKPYLTVDLKTNAVNGGKKSGDTNQQWMWRGTGDCDARASKNLVNVATGGCLTRKGKGALVSSECEENAYWWYNDEDATLEEETSWEWARLVKRKSALRIVSEMKYLKGTHIPWGWFQWDIEYVETTPTAPPYKLQPEDPGCYESDCPPGCQLVLIAKLMESFGGLYYGIPATEAHIAVSPNTRQCFSIFD